MLKTGGFENIIKSKAATGIEIILLPGNGFEINVVTLKRIKSAITTKQQLNGIKSIDELAEKINNKLPLILIINGKGIIHRKVAVSDNDANASLLNKVLPNAHLNEFYIQKENIDSTIAFVSVIRANVIDDIINEFKKNKLSNIVECLLGPFVVNTLLPLIDSTVISNEQLSIDNYHLQIRENRISDVKMSETNSSSDSIRIGDERVESKLLIAFAASLSYFTGYESEMINAVSLQDIKEEYKQKQKFQFYGWSLLAASFLVLIINYFIFSYYWNNNNEMNSKLILNQSALKRYETLKTEYSQKKEFLEQNGLLENSQTSYYADRLARDLPQSIQWTDVDIHPLKKKMLMMKAIPFFENKSIKIAGKCNRNTELNDWMKTLKQNAWITNVTLLNYAQDNAKDDGVFLIEIKLK